MSLPLPAVFSFWFGPLSWLERLSIQSFLDHGHAFTLYGYERPEGLPAGCTWRDASEIIPRSEMFFYKKDRTPATFADLFRLEMMKRSAGIWVDCDMVCVRPFADLDDHVFAYETLPDARHGGQINNAVLRLPPDSPLLDDLLAIFKDMAQNRTPVWMPRHRRLEIALRRALGQKIGLTDFQFGATGPFPLTYYARQHGLEDHALPVESFYPLPYDKAALMLESGSRLADYLAPSSYAVHLWRMALTSRSRQATPEPPAPDSALGALLDRHGVSA